ncbi:MAG: leucine-rich repeat protein [bacterium]
MRVSCDFSTSRLGIRESLYLYAYSSSVRAQADAIAKFGFENIGESYFLQAVSKSLNFTMEWTKCLIDSLKDAILSATWECWGILKSSISLINAVGDSIEFGNMMTVYGALTEQPGQVAEALRTYAVSIDNLANLWRSRGADGTFSSTDSNDIRSAVDTLIADGVVVCNDHVSDYYHGWKAVYYEPSAKDTWRNRALLAYNAARPLVWYDVTSTSVSLNHEKSSLLLMNQAIASEIITVSVRPANPSFSVTVDGASYVGGSEFRWLKNSTHTIGVTSPQNGSTFLTWNDNGGQTHSVTPQTSQDYIVTFSGGAGSASVTLTAIKDATLSESYPNTNYGNLAYTTMDLSGVAGSRKYAIFEFDLSSIPYGSIIDTVELYLYATYCVNPGSASTWLGVLGSAWNETSVTWNSPRSITTGMSGYQTNTTTGLHSWSSDSYPELKTLVGNWVQGTKSNYGFLMERGQGATGETYYRTRHSSVSTERPQLYISYTPPPTVNVGFDSEGGSFCSGQTYTVGQTYGSLPSTSRTGYSFGGWWTGDNGTGTRIYTSSTVSDSTLFLYAKWIDLAGIDYDYTVSNEKVTITRYKGAGGAVTIPNTIDAYPVRIIQSGTFYNCSSLISVTIPASVTNIGQQAFCLCTGLTSVTIPNSVISLGDQAFQGCTNLTNAVIGSGITSFGFNTFYGCSSLTSFVIPNSVTSIGSLAFAFCSGLISFTIPDSVTNIVNNAFYSCSKLTSITVETDNQVYSSLEGILYDRGQRILILCPVGRIGCVTIPYNITDIEAGAFYGCSGLTGITIPDSVTNIGGSVFYGCSGLTNITIPDPVTSIGDVAFGMSGLTSITIPNSVTNIGNGLFTRCINLQRIIIPNSVTSIGSRAFSGCSSLTNITVTADNPNYSSSDGVLFDKANANLIRYPSLKPGTYAIPNSVTSIASFAFAYCTALIHVSFGNNVTSISDNAFLSCRPLTSIVFPPSVSYIGEKAFLYSSLINVFFEGKAPNTTSAVFGAPATIYYLPGKTGWGTTFSGRPTALWPAPIPVDYSYTNGMITITKYTGSDEALTIPSTIHGLTVTAIGSNAFYRCTSLTSVTIPDSVTEIGLQAFDGCYGLTSITIPKSVTSIGEGALQYCISLASILFGGNAPNDLTSLNSGSPAIIYYLPNTTGWGTSFCGCPTLLWNPQIQRDEDFGFASEHFGFNIAGTTNIPIVVEACTNLSSSIWDPLTNATLGTLGSVYFSDPSSTNAPARFYRIVWPR